MAATVRAERRASQRTSPLVGSGMNCARLRPGRTAHIIDLSAGGALIETEWRLLPGTRVDLQIGDPIPLFRVGGRVLRCHVALLERQRVRYRGALAFDYQLPVGELSTPCAGSSV